MSDDDLTGERGLSSEDVIATLSAALIERYGDEALAVALRQAELAEGLPRESWDAIVARLRETGGGAAPSAPSDG